MGQAQQTVREVLAAAPNPCPDHAVFAGADYVPVDASGGSMDPKILLILEKLRSRIADKYTIRDLRVFGSSARGDRRTGSDIDVLVCLPELNRAIEEELFDMAYDLEIEYDCLIDLIAVSEQDLEGPIGSGPIYEKILTEGIAV